jgi:hypothetical protein
MDVARIDLVTSRRELPMSDGTLLSDYVGFLEYLASTISRTGGVPVTRAKCPECSGQWSVWKRVCPSSDEYECGYRAIWKCENPECGEMEVR